MRKYPMENMIRSSGASSLRRTTCFVLILLFASSVVATPNLPFGDVNVLVLTDVHSWVGGHREREPNLNVDYGHVLSFYERVKQICNENNKDFWFVMNGDWIDGTGLAMNGDPSHLIPLLEKMPWDVVNIGNHELYREKVIDFMRRPGGFVKWLGPRYLTSNVLDAVTHKPIGNRYRILRGRNSVVLVFGFLYNMKDNHPSVLVQEVQQTTVEPWFTQALHEEAYDAVMVLAHMDVEDPLVEVILSKIRAELGDDMPVQFITGHTHFRRFQQVDDLSVSFEAGRFLDTIGFVSFPKKASVAAVNENTVSSTAVPAINATDPGGNVTENATAVAGDSAIGPRDPADLFKYAFLNGSIDVLRDTIYVTHLDTDNGKALSKFIARTRKDLGLEEVVGCAPQSFYLERTLEEDDSLWRLFRDHVVPFHFHGDEILFVSKDSCRYNMLEGVVQVDDVIAVSPFNRTLYLWEEVPSEIIVQLNRTMNENRGTYLPMLPEFIFCPTKRFFPEGGFYDLLIESQSVPLIHDQINAIIPPGEGEFPAPIETNTTMTSVWMNFFSEKLDVCADLPDSPEDTGPGQNPNMTAGGLFQSTSVPDRFRLVFALVAVLAVVGLGSVYVWQLDGRYRQVERERQRIIFEAQQELENEDEDEDEDGELL